MKSVFKTYRPEGFRSVNTYLFVENPQELIDFLKTAFYVVEVNSTTDPSNADITNCILKIGDSCFMISQAREQFIGMKTALYLFVDNVDEIYNRAIECGATNEFKPEDMPCDDRQAGIIDPGGNYWWISKRQNQKSILIELETWANLKIHR